MITNLIRRICLLALLAPMPLGLLNSHAAARVPPRPEQITFAPLQFEAPRTEDFRHVLSNGVVVYLAPSHEFPLVNLVFTFKGGSFLDPVEEIGLASTMGAMVRRGGTTTIKAAAVDEEFDFLAAQASTSARGMASAASLNCLKSNFDSSFKLFLDMVRNPGFQQDRLDVYKAEVIEKLKQRNDDADPILNREWRALLYGRDHFEAAEPTAQSIASITRDDLLTMHQRIFHPAAGQMFIAVTGDFDEGEMLSKLENALAGWHAGKVIGDPPPPTATFTPGVYHVEKNIPQGKVIVGLRGTKRDDPDYFPLLLMDYILGGGGFTSRITNRVRSDEGLAYHAGSDFQPRVWYPGELRAEFQSKNETVAIALKMIMQEFTSIANEPVREEELEIAKNSFIETLPRTFESKAGMLAVFVNDEITNRPRDYWQKYREHIRAVTAADIQRVAKKYLKSDEVAILIVGKWEEIAAGDPQKRGSMNELFSGNVTHLPLRDPLTLQPVR
jgi:zinc protease